MRSVDWATPMSPTNFERAIADRTAKIFAQQNTTMISENRECLSTAVKALLLNDPRSLHGIDFVDFQIAPSTNRMNSFTYVM